MRIKCVVNLIDSLCLFREINSIAIYLPRNIKVCAGISAQFYKCKKGKSALRRDANRSVLLRIGKVSRFWKTGIVVLKAGIEHFAFVRLDNFSQRKAQKFRTRGEEVLK